VKAKFEVTPDTVAMLRDLRPLFNVHTTAQLLRKAVALAVVCATCAGEDGRVEIVGDRANRTIDIKA
jgi:hypothetical protein